MSAGGARATRAESGFRRPGHGAGRRARGTLAPLFSHVLRLQLRSVILWGLALGLLNLITVASFPAVEDQSQVFNDLVESYPPEVRNLFGIGEGTDLTTVEGFLAAQTFNFIAPLALAFFPILASASALAGAEERGAMDVLLGNPLPRWQLVVGNFLATAVSLLGILAILGLFTWIPAKLMDIDLSLGKVAEAVLNMWPLCVSLGSLAMLCSAVFHRRVLAVAIPGAVLVAMYFVNALGNTVEGLEDARPFTVFYHYGSAIENGVDWPSFIGVTLAALLLLLLAALAFNRRDIYT